ELPGAMQAKHLDPSGPIEEFGLIVVLTFAAAAIPLLVLRGAPAPSPATRRRRAAAALSPGEIAREAILVAALLPLYFAFLDLFTLDPRWLFSAAVVVIVALRFAVPARSFALAPLAVVLQIGWPRPRPAAIAAIAWIIVTPLLLRRFDVRRAVPWVCALFAFAYPLALLGVASPPALDFFEDGHELVTAAEMARGERPYADIVPVHGFLSDGGIDWIAMKSGADSAGAILKTKRVVSALNLVAIYAVVLGATGSAELGLLATLLAVALIPSATIWVRTIPSLFALAASAAAIRLRSSRWILAAGVLTSIAFLFGMEFAIYSGIVSLVVALRMRALRAVLIGVVAGAVPVLVLFLACGSVGALLHTTLYELLPAGRVYVPGPLQLPVDRVPWIVWICALVFAAATLRRSIKRADAVWAIAFWGILAGVSYAQRRHLYADFVVAAFLMTMIWLVARRSRLTAVALAVLVLVVAHPLNHVFAVATPLRLAGGVQAGGNPIIDGAIVSPPVRDGVAAAHAFAATRLRANETWFDFANSPALYFLLRRSCPTRHHQVPFYETEVGQREVIVALERDRTVRAALLAFPGGEPAIDGVPNRERAPLVWRYLETHFTPAFAQNGVVFWMRR
ncbi:MAG: hypothetical protein ACXVJT_01435, partial [Thermoanaerobaculia bacterium]